MESTTDLRLAKLDTPRETDNRHSPVATGKGRNAERMSRDIRS